MNLFEPLVNDGQIVSYMLYRAGKKKTPRQQRYARKYRIFQNPERPDWLPPETLNIVGFVRNRLKSLGRNYKHGKFRTVWIKKNPYDDGPRMKRSVPGNADDYRRIIVLNSVDLLMEAVLADRMRSKLYSKGLMQKMRSRKENIRTTATFIEKAVANNYVYFFQTDIKRYGQSYDLGLAVRTIFDALSQDMDDEDRELFRNVHRSFRKKVMFLRCSGSPIEQLLAEWMLNRLDHHIMTTHGEIHENHFLRFGEDMIFAFPTKDACHNISIQLKTIVKNILGDDCELHESILANIEIGDYLVPTNLGKGTINDFDISNGLDFCGYNYAFDDGGSIKISIRDKTMMKIQDRIRQHIDVTKERSFDNLEGYEDSILMVQKLNNLFGYYRHYGTDWRFSMDLGVTQLFILPEGIDDQFVYEQAEILNQYMVRRVRGYYGRDMHGETDRIKSYRLEIDRYFRSQHGLRTILDGIKKTKSILHKKASDNSVDCS